MDFNLLKENRQHGDFTFPIGFYTMVYHDPSGMLDLHWHDELEFLLMTAGTATFRVGDNQIMVKEGQALFIKSGEIHSAFSDGGVWGFSAIVFHPNLLNSNPYDKIQNDYVNPIKNRQYVFTTLIAGEELWERELIDHLKKIIEIAGKKEYTYELLIKAHLYSIFSLLLRNAKTETERDLKYKCDRLKNVIQYIQTNYNRHIHLSELSRMANMSEGHFCRYFKKIVAKTPIEYLNYIRVIKACDLLRNTDRKILDVAMEVGFNNFSYFIDRFKKYMKITPAEYRKKYRF
ncbi:AraC family HTH transcriptional regulator [Thermoclostridium stercorarium subsp. stercorarium DSM 8532]|uniref:AraC family HTH transcriptional regulator n=3 Tax=Thermoclostridium stercorarium TaxID=1510 RepID=L7VNH2_THES1|nr:AraC family transcriptional regulator [Thermoclostridium stercorarium]AGC68209.1 AraC family HTH transcriptional regulator [Thermoclostridium stercorarium subsp. stercorarium DSM 8532]AGI39239.1 DNA-binding domain-containing protein [Thermoclostridium stercorarium subsp. stercorarium DSM 8532]ANW98579.1 AraC family transcriptional regulator [Thermoclostridium stercorarium subsp. thermolacticum DSM 2910]ANX01117.1 AraC family transcriptional regulator [Thermoclostridium stercorarium subsp. le